MPISKSFVLFFGSLALLCGGGTVAAVTTEQVMYVGTNVEGIYASKIDLDTGAMSSPKVVGDARQPSFFGFASNVADVVCRDARVDPTGWRGACI